MASHSPALVELCECLRGELPRSPDWVALIGLANETLTTPLLINFVNQFENQIPADVCAYVRSMYELNDRRSQRLADQLAEAVAALNSYGIIPLLIKGATTLATKARAHRSTKLMADLDICIPPDQIESAFKALFAIGYTLEIQQHCDSEAWYAELKREKDVSMLDLRRSLPGPTYFYQHAGNIAHHSMTIQIGSGSAYIPSATLQAFMLIIHDEFEDHDYWLGGLDLRHLADLRDLISVPDCIDWDQLISFAPNGLVRNALETQLIAAAELLKADVPSYLRRRVVPRLQFRRRLLQARFPLLRRPLLATAVLDYANYRMGVGARYRKATQSRARRWLPRTANLQSMLALALSNRVGKV